MSDDTSGAHVIGPTGPIGGGPANTGSGAGGVTGASGNTGAVGPTGVHKVTTINPVIKARVWDETPQGARLRNAYGSVHKAYQSQLPSIRQQIKHLQHRPIGG